MLGLLLQGMSRIRVYCPDTIRDHIERLESYDAITRAFIKSAPPLTLAHVVGFKELPQLSFRDSRTTGILPARTMSRH